MRRVYPIGSQARKKINRNHWFIQNLLFNEQLNKNNKFYELI